MDSTKESSEKPQENGMKTTQNHKNESEWKNKIFRFRENRKFFEKKMPSVHKI